jgi:hypothetical protein
MYARFKKVLEQPAHSEALFNPICSLAIYTTRNISGKEKLKKKFVCP